MGVEFVSVVDQIDTSTAMGRFFFHVMSAISERGYLADCTHEVNPGWKRNTDS